MDKTLRNKIYKIHNVPICRTDVTDVSTYIIV